jgi:uncharacterized damage-inducible protein DinB
MSPQADVHRKAHEYVAGRDVVALLAELPAKLEAAIKGLDFKTRHCPEAVGKWSIHDVVTHLADCEVVYRFRMRVIAAENEPTLQPFDENAFAARLHYGETPLEESLAVLQTLRSANVRWLKTLKPDDMARAAQHPERGRETLRDVATLIAWHDARHLAQIARIRAGFLGGVGA